MNDEMKGGCPLSGVMGDRFERSGVLRSVVYELGLGLKNLEFYSGAGRKEGLPAAMDRSSGLLADRIKGLTDADRAVVLSFIKGSIADAGAPYGAEFFEKIKNAVGVRDESVLAPDQDCLEFAKVFMHVRELVREVLDEVLRGLSVKTPREVLNERLNTFVDDVAKEIADLSNLFHAAIVDYVGGRFDSSRMSLGGLEFKPGIAANKLEARLKSSQPE